MERQSSGKISRTVLVIGYGWEQPRKGEKERQFRQTRRRKKGQETAVYPSLPPSKMSRAVDSVAIDIYRSKDHESENQAEIILVTGTRMGHVASFPEVQESYFHTIAPDVPVTNIGKAWTTSREVRRYFKYLRRQGEESGTIVFLAPHEERIHIIVDSVAKQRRNRKMEEINFVQADKYLSDGSLPSIPTEGEAEVRIGENFADLPQTPNYRQFATYEEGARELQRRAERLHAMTFIDYLFKFKRPNNQAGIE